MIGALTFGDLRLVREGARRLDGVHHRFRAGIAETDLLEGGNPLAEQLRKADFQLGRHGEGGATLDLIAHRRIDRRMRVAMDQGVVVVGEVDPLYAFRVGQAAAAAV